MKNFLLFLIAAMVFVACNRQSKPDSDPEATGKDLFTALQKCSNSNSDGYEELIALFLRREVGYSFYKETVPKLAKVSDWSKIRYVNYFHKEIEKNGKKYSAAFLAIDMNADADYDYTLSKLTGVKLWVLNLQDGQGYKILAANDEWSKHSIDGNYISKILQNLDRMAEQCEDIYNSYYLMFEKGADVKQK
jgi:hypothetical protein